VGASSGFVGLAIYDRAGRKISQLSNSNNWLFLCLHSDSPIARARIFRANPAVAPEILLGFIWFDHIVSPTRTPRQSSVLLRSGERLSGVVTDETKAGFKLQCEFLGGQSQPVEILFSELECYEPPLAADAGEKVQPQKQSLLHGVLLQNGETFRARFVKLDDKEAVFILPGEASLKLPRQLLRKIDLLPEITAADEAPQPTVVGADEKPGVEFKPKAGGAAVVEEKQPPGTNGPAKSANRADGEIIAADAAAGDLTVRDKTTGDFSFGFALAKTLIFAPVVTPPVSGDTIPIAAQSGHVPGNKSKGWLLCLREGSCFEAALKALSPYAITVELCGGEVVVPLKVVDCLKRK